ncbi:cobalamin B12-binding domain-containing protein [Spirilliplanes yamanashiensis]|uniref:Cobalamin-binding protein n=1 Tax=Spirilliplanes yamanashiensis TaxID=42233 RepID=A0A8J3YAY1_9ACTN|nr:cobalamin B12-binding domain-containing protein [Spirilliplanes yamanashiensis]MDP9817744.1 methanogenic corrinoid protein MtbC1 [Spirilliplanes yamanashiensis]GIJ04554.1 cobalamin-binding protein [Spirilliplanes yamanashiensis]
MSVDTIGPGLDRPGLSDEYLGLLGDGDEYGAVELALGLLGAGVPPERILLDLIAPTQAKVGELWAANAWSVAREHAATAISERVVAAVAARTNRRPGRGRLTVACTDGEWHALPVRILAEVLRLRGWQVDFLGANVPGPHLITHLHQTGSDVVALSCTLPTRLPRAHAAITACQAVGVPVIAGGAGFGRHGRHALLLGADAWAATAEEAADRLEHDWPPAASGDPHSRPFLGDDEYTEVVRGRGEFLAVALGRLAAAYPEALAYDERQRDATLEDYGHIADFLAAALYVDDPDVFTDFIGWTAAVLTARGVPPAALSVGLEAYRAQLRHYPRASAILQAGIAAVDAAG